MRYAHLRFVNLGYNLCVIFCAIFLSPSLSTIVNMFAARRLAASFVPRVALNASVRANVAAPMARKAVVNTSIARFLNTNALEQKRATVQRK